LEKPKFENGVHDISNSDYHGSHGISRSALMQFKRSPYHYWYQYLKPDKVIEEPTPSMILGELVHTMVLEPLLINERYVVSPTFDRRTKAGKEDYQAFTELAKGKTIVTEDMAAKATTMAKMAGENEAFQTLIEDSIVERSIYFTHQPTGLQVKCRPDSWNHTIVTDLKTSADASYRAFQSSASKFGYFLQAGMMYEALKSLDIKMEKFVFAVIESSEPHCTAVYLLEDEAIDYGIGMFDSLMEQLAECMESNKWEAYGIQNLSLPRWAFYEELE
jgi:hypothetical protein